MNLTQNNINLIGGRISPEVVKGCAAGLVIAVAVIGILTFACLLVVR